MESAPTFPLIRSAKANDSPFVKNEVNRAFSQRKAIFAFRVEDELPSGSLEFSLARQHWMDGFPPPRGEEVETLAGAINTRRDSDRVGITKSPDSRADNWLRRLQ